jgi:acetyl/propionyl-CoA carboxylase alpha subunit
LRVACVYSPVDRSAPHVRLADAAVPLPGDAPADSYLNIAALLEAARAAGARAVHPGYGFLAENPAFADAVSAADLVYIGPTADVLRICGNKAQTRESVSAAGVPVLPGTGVVSDGQLAGEAAQVGFPLLIKAVGGGGGKGIHLVRAFGELHDALRLARGEAHAAFGDDRVYLERWLPGARHVEVQVLADATGRVVALGERDCSVQRRHQKLIEETPAPGLTSTLRARLLEAAEAGARAVGYRSAGTFEFLVDGEAFYFLEVNARLQVEHPVTEMVTGQDLVVEQLRIALEGRMRVPERIVPAGHAIEARISAEDPHEDFFPSAGRIDGVLHPGGPGIRVDSALEAGVEVTRHYDPLLGKVIAWGGTREEAVARLHRALSETAISGVPTTIPFHLWALEDEEFLAARHTTGFVQRWEARARGRHERLAVIAAAAAEHLARQVPRVPAAGPSRGWLEAARAEGLRDA